MSANTEPSPNQRREAVCAQVLQDLMQRSAFVGNPTCFDGVSVRHDGMIAKMGKPVFGIIVGEVDCSTGGTKLSAKGNKYPAEEKVTSRERIKYQITARMPTTESMEFKQEYLNQIAQLEELVTIAEGGIDRKAKFLEGGKRIRPFALTLDGAEGVIPMVTETSIYEEIKRPAGPEASDPHALLCSVEQARKSVEYPISTLTRYHPCCLNDYGGEQFESHGPVHLRQKDMRDVKDELVEPWKLPEVYRDGTLFMALCTFKRWVIGGTSSKRDEGDHTYSVIMQKVRVLDPSLQDVEDSEAGLAKPAVTDFDSFHITFQVKQDPLPDEGSSPIKPSRSTPYPAGKPSRRRRAQVNS